MNNHQLPSFHRYLACGLMAATLVMTGCSVFKLKQETAAQPSGQQTRAVAVRTAQPAQSAPAAPSQSSPLAPERVGYYMDVQFANLQQKLNGNSLSISHRDNKIIIVIPGESMFDSNSARIKSVIEPALTLIADVLNQYDQTKITVAGHSDAQGELAYNQRLSEQRAMAVGQYLTRGNITANRVIVRGFGPNQPIGDNSSPAGRAQNRRVELILEPIIVPGGSLRNS
ncbi:OmpA family protein [Porticoccus sp.]